jgi:TRAP-type C4-dicarboxylate transport system substrate-binding protein
LTGHIYTPLLVLFSPDVMDELSPAQQAALRKAGEAGSAASRDYAEASQRSDMSKLVAAGMTVIEDIDRRALREAAAAAIETLSAEFGTEALRRMRGLVA